MLINLADIQWQLEW